MFYQRNFTSSSVPVVGILALAFSLFLTRHALASDEASTLGAVMCNAFQNTKPFGMLFSYIAYAAGIVSILLGVYHLQQHSESRQNHPMHKPLLMWAGGGCLLALPNFIGTIENSFYTVSATGLGDCTAGAVAGGQSLDLMLAGFVGNIKGPLVALVSVIAIVCGLWMIVNGLMKASKHGVDARSNSMLSILVNVLFGALLMTIGDNLSIMLDTVFGTTTASTIDSTTVTSWGFVSALGGGSAQFGNAIAAALTFFQLIGVIAFVRGWLIMKKVVEGGGNVTMAQGITHIVGGVLAINIAAFLKIMDTTFGTNLM